MYKYLFGLLLTFNFTWYTCQISDQMKALAKPLDNISYAESSHIGVAGQKSKIYNQFKELAKVASNEDLYYFAKNGSNALKVYSGEELFQRNDKRFFDIYTYYSQNPLMMKYMVGCVSSNKNIAEFLKDKVYSAQQSVLVRNSLLKEKNISDKVRKKQLEQFKKLGYDTFTEENLNLTLKQLEEIDKKTAH